MKNVFLVMAFTIMATNITAQKNFTNDVIVSGAIEIGGNYWEQFGRHATGNVALYSEIYAVHKSGFGIAYFAYDDFSTEKIGRLRLFDAFYSYTWENAALYTALEYISYDNWHDGVSIMPYTIATLSYGTWSYEVAPMLICFPHFDQNKYEFIAYGKIKKNILRDIDIHATLWYDNMYEKHFYGAVGAELNLPKDWYIKTNLLYRDEKFTPFISLGWRFTTD